MAQSRLKLLFVHERFGAFGGAESNVLAVARELQQRGHAVGLLHGAPTGQGEGGWRDVFQTRFTLAPNQGAKAARGAVRTFQPEAIYVHKMADLDVLEALLASGKPLLRMVHDHDLYCMRSYKYNVFTRRICQRGLTPYCLFPCAAFVARNRDGEGPLKWVSYSNKRKELECNRKFDRLIVASRFMRQELLRNGFDVNKIEILPPVPPPAEGSLRSNFSNRNLVIYAGQITRGKGVDVLLESLKLVRAPFECSIFGEGHHREHCERLSRRLKLTSRVQFKGYAPPVELASHFRECSVAVVSSVWPEPFGAVGLEAMRHGVPVVAFDAGAIREWLIDGCNGFLVPWMDRPAFAARVEQLLLDKSLARRLGEQARQMVAERYVFSRYIDGLEDLFARAVGDNRQVTSLLAARANVADN